MDFVSKTISHNSHDIPKTLSKGITSRKLHQSMTEMSDFERLIEKITLICYLVIALSTILLWYGLGYNRSYTLCNDDNIISTDERTQLLCQADLRNDQKSLFEGSTRLFMSGIVFVLTIYLSKLSNDRNKQYIAQLFDKNSQNE
jgi:hypothetical protein